LKKEPNIFKTISGKLTGLRLDRRVTVFLFFLFVSSIFWFLSALGREYTTHLRYPVRFTNYPENLIMVNELPSSLELTVNAYGYTIIKHYIGRRLLPIVFNVNSFSLNRMPDTDTKNFYVLSSVARNRIAGQLGADIEILDIRPDTLFFRFTDMVTGRLPVKPVLDLHFEQQFMIKGNILVEPDSVDVSGPGVVIDTMQFVPTIAINKRGVKGSLKETVRLSEPAMLNFSDTRVTVSIPVEQFTEASLRIPIDVLNLPDTLTMKIFPSQVTVSYLVALSDYDRVNAQQFRAMVDYDNIPAGNGRLNVEIEKHPGFIKSVRFSPVFVDYIIEK
jgi:hypothetical protein